MRGQERKVWFALVVFALSAGCVGSGECDVEDALLDSGDVLLICSGDGVTPETLQAQVAGDRGFIVVATPRPREEAVAGSPSIVGPDEPTGLYLTRPTERLAYAVTDSLGSPLSGTIDVIAWNGDAYISDEFASPICLEPAPTRPHLFQCDRYGRTHHAHMSPVVLFLMNDRAGLVLLRWGRLGADDVVYVGVGNIPLESLRR